MRCGGWLVELLSRDVFSPPPAEPRRLDGACCSTRFVVAGATLPVLEGIIGRDPDGGPGASIFLLGSSSRRTRIRVSA